jgi:hypothetical protein
VAATPVGQEKEETMPPLQKRALYQTIAAILLIAILALYNWIGIALLVFAALIVLPLALWLPRYLTRTRPGEPVIEDERDRAIISNVPRYQAVAVILAVTIWFMVLSQVYKEQREVPLGPLSLMWVSVSAVYVASYAVGVLIEYWRAKSGFVMGEGLKGSIMIAVTIAFFSYWGVVVMQDDTKSYPFDPQADFTSNVTLVHVGDPVRFADTTQEEDSSYMEAPAGRRWEFGDCTHSGEADPVHSYSSQGHYTVELAIFYAGGREVTAVKESYITVLPSESP